jgi:hypothetical protein
MNKLAAYVNEAVSDMENLLSWALDEALAKGDVRIRVSSVADLVNLRGAGRLPGPGFIQRSGGLTAGDGRKDSALLAVPILATRRQQLDRCPGQWYTRLTWLSANVADPRANLAGVRGWLRVRPHQESSPLPRLPRWAVSVGCEAESAGVAACRDQPHRLVLGHGQ